MNNLQIQTDSTDHFWLMCPICKTKMNAIEVNIEMGHVLYLLCECPKCNNRGQRKILLGDSK